MSAEALATQKLAPPPVGPTKKSCLRHLNEYRAKIIRFFAYPTPGLQSGIPFVGGRTVLELLVVFGLLVIAFGVIFQGGATFAVDLSGLICITLALRYNYALKIINLPFERALFWHKVFAIVFLITMVVHAVQQGANNTGIIIACAAGAMSFIYIVKPYHFEVFYYTHLVNLIILCVTCFFHGGKFVFFGLLGWICDIILRYGLFAKRITVKAMILPGNVIRFEFPRTFSYEAGQYCFIRIYDINPFEFHPFSLSSSPYDDVTTIHIRALGNWTKKLLAHIEEKEPIKGLGVNLDILVEGPFGLSMIDWENSKEYEVFLLVSGGVGITPMQSIFTQLIHEQQFHQRKVRKAVFIWSAKDLDMVHAFNQSDEEDALRLSQLNMNNQLNNENYNNNQPSTSRSSKFQLPATTNGHGNISINSASNSTINRFSTNSLNSYRNTNTSNNNSHNSSNSFTTPRKVSIALDNMPLNFQPMMADIPEILYEVDLFGSDKSSNNILPDTFINPVMSENNSVDDYNTNATTLDVFSRPYSNNSNKTIRSNRNDSMSDTIYSIASPLIFLPRFHITSLKTKNDIYTTTLVASQQTGTETDDNTRKYILKPNRPHLKTIFLELKELCYKEGYGKVAVLVCGPQTMVNEVQDLCRQSQIEAFGCFQKRKVVFDCHQEVFDF